MPKEKDINIDKNSKEYKRLYQRFYYYKRRADISFRIYHLEYYRNKGKFNKKTFSQILNNTPSEESLNDGVLIFE